MPERSLNGQAAIGSDHLKGLGLPATQFRNRDIAKRQGRDAVRIGSSGQAHNWTVADTFEWTGGSSTPEARDTIR